MLELRNLNTLYGNIQVLHDISLHVQQGEIITLIGANGAGKSTILMSICGIVPPRSGEILFNGTSLVHMSPNNIVALGLSQVPEGRHIFPELTVAENLDMGAFLRKDTQQIQRDLDHVYTLFPILADRRSQPGGNLSGGEQQMLALSRALMARPRLLLLDEPSMGLAPLVIQQIFDIIQKINREDSTTIFLVEQNAHLALKIADRGYVLENGRITMHDQADILLGNKDIQRAYLGI
ncbi:MAG: ABC transporter ATP-binding protein [Candidatus Electrothrix sp. LOE1_4_5]|nr:ABC transporter ATP-binding protein [Candidatus Electrothrix sp. AX1]MCI5116567.1 ABC transporter ATP-binding protein [Candidatus Electrothrix gigas]MCI5189271.1 ABC transporter ATP-binding protein [Candidatus Electrothrix gigas]MCI5192436.1 ABC transporter ATP-binding protein [Candidatus Electrothrix gigas]MCI5196865.1 ABC transporter ATP-binding protein [Candidatus Electrothrix gigas]